jgi:glycosyltransferase involved in cell wall biosynthesis
MKLLYLINSLESGGAEILLIHTVNALQKKVNCRIHIVTVTNTSDIQLKELLSPEIVYQHINCNGFNIFSGIKAIKEYIRLNDITHVHTHLYDATIISRFAVPKTIKLFTTYHNMSFSPSATYYSKWHIWLEKLTFRNRYVSIYVSIDVAKSVEKVRQSKPDKYFILPNFSDSSISYGYTFKPSGSLKLVSIANLKKVKNIDFAIDALSELKNYSISWDIYGEGEVRKYFEGKINATGSAIKLPGRKLISNDVLLPYDLFIITSFDEGMPISLLEAMNFGMPSLLPDHMSVMRDVAGESAIYYSIKDKEQFQKILVNLLNNKEQLVNMSKIALQRSKLFSKSSHIDKLLKIYEDQM